MAPTAKSKATKKQEKPQEVEKIIFKGDNFDSEEALSQIVENVVVVEMLRSILQEHKEITGHDSLEDLQKICRKFNIKDSDGKGFRGKEKDSLIDMIQSHFFENIQNESRITETYREFFGSTNLVYKISDFVLFSRHIPSENEEDTNDKHPYKTETLGTGNNELEDSEVEEIVFELLDFLTRNTADNVYIRNKQPDFNLDLFKTEDIYMQVKYKNPLEMV